MIKKVLTKFLTALSYVTTISFGQRYSGLDSTYTEATGNATAPSNDKGINGEEEAVQDADCDEREKNPLAGLAKYLPAVGLVVGSVLSCIYFVTAEVLHASALVISAVVVVAWLVVTGGLHFDGLMDSADGICSHRDRQRILEIMQDSRVGNFGAMTGLSVLLLKFAALSCLLADQPAGFAVLILVPAWARWSEVYAIARFPYAREEGKGKIWHDTTSTRDLLLSAMVPLTITVTLSLMLGWTFPVLLTIFTCLSGVCFSHWLSSFIGGQTGDTYGAVVELSETATLLLMSMVAHLQP